MSGKGDQRHGLRFSGANLRQPRGHFAQRARAGELFHHALHEFLLCFGAGALEGTQYLDAFNGIDAKVGFDGRVDVQHVGWVPGAVADDGDQFLEHAAHRTGW